MRSSDINTIRERDMGWVQSYLDIQENSLDWRGENIIKVESNKYWSYPFSRWRSGIDMSEIESQLHTIMNSFIVVMVSANA